MRMGVILLLSALATSCSGAEKSPEIEQVQIRVSGWSSEDVTVNSLGEGQYHLSDPLPNGTDGSFSITPQQFVQLVKRLEPFWQKSVPITDKSEQEFVEGRCPQGVPRVTDAGAIYVRWIGASSRRHYLAELGCDYERNSARNKELLGVVKSLPVPVDW